MPTLLQLNIGVQCFHFISFGVVGKTSIENYSRNFTNYETICLMHTKNFCSFLDSSPSRINFLFT